ncbi:Sbal_3080 family lipoprotein [Nevskia sp.]|uniref:Sbal_3080 family lipoprotein n=1 Tax=Nevskia sp. TaxID=1929292 RepID=UPI0025D99E9C|nr:Sbal_3080 family lipoprotein [Nevskia sp.]
MKGIIAIVVVALAGCTSVKVRPLAAEAAVKHVCIQDNPKVTVPDFVTIVRDGFDRHGLSTEIVTGTPPKNCETLLTYTALRSWDVVTYLSHAELRLERGGRQIGYAEYHLKGGGGFALNKWASTKSKMDPVIDQLLGDYR